MTGKGGKVERESRTDLARTARRLLRSARSGALSTAGRDAGWPYCSLVTVACDTGAAPILLLSTLADHTRNLQADARASLLVERASGLGNPQAGPRLTVMGRIEPTGDAGHAARFLARHPSAARYAGFADFRFYRLLPARAHFVGGFARACWLTADELTLPAEAANKIARAEADVLDHMNRDHADAVALYANRLLGRRGGPWRMIAVDPEGCDLARGRSVARLDFSHMVATPEGLREELVRLAAQARERPG